MSNEEIGIAVNEAAKTLPKGFIISIDIENGGYDVNVSNDDMTYQPNTSEGLVEDIYEGIRMAINRAKDDAKDC